MSSVLPAKVAVQQQLFSVLETAIITGRSESSIWRDLRVGRLESVHIAGSTRITLRSIEAACNGDAPKPTRKSIPVRKSKSSAGAQPDRP
jgi:hypothetical protein